MPDAMVRYYAAVEDAKIARTLSIVGFGAGAALLTAGTVLVLTARPAKASSSTAFWYRPVAFWYRPVVQTDGAGAMVGGAW